MATEYTQGERFLIRVFEAYLRDIFQHNDAHRDENLVELVTRTCFDDVEAASLLAENELGSEIAATLCRRACLFREMAKELSQLLATDGPAELDDLSMVQRMNYSEELRQQFEPAHANDPPPAEPEQSSTEAEPADNPWSTLLNLHAQMHETRRHVDCTYLNARDASEENEVTRGTIERNFLATVEGFASLELHIDSLFGWLRANDVPSPGMLKAREAIAAGREIREVVS